MSSFDTPLDGAGEPPRPATAPPADVGDEDERLERRVVPYWLLAGVAGSLVSGGFLFGVYHWFGHHLPAELATPVPVVVFGLWGLRLLWALISPPLAWQRWRFRIHDQLMLLRWGIIFHAERAIPISRMQHVDMRRGPIERMFGLTTLVVHTAGTEESSFPLPGLRHARAMELRDQILAARGDDVV